MDDLIKALQIFRKYGNPTNPTHCEHDIMYIMIDPDIVSDEDKAALEELDFEPDHDITECFSSFRFGAA